MRMLYSVLLSLIIGLIFITGNLTQAQVVADNVTTRTGDATSNSFSHSVSGTDRLLIVGILIESEESVSNITYNGQSLTRVGERVNSQGDPRADVWMLINPPTGSHNVSVTFTAKTKFVIGAVTFTGVYQTEPVNNIVTGQGQSTTSPSITVSSKTGDLVMDVVIAYKSVSLFNIGAGQTTVWKRDINNDATKTAAASTEPGAPSVTMSWSGNEKWAGVAFNIQSSNGSLPVELTSFTAALVNNHVNLNWTTATETQNYGFDIERKSNNSNWEKIGFVEGHGNSNSPKEYSFSDKNLKAGSYSYRLKQIDTDGQFEYSDIVKVDFNMPKEFQLNQNYPNPFNPSTKITFSLPVASKVSLLIYNILGEKVMDAIIDQVYEAGVYEYNFDGSKLSSGTYLYSIQADNFTQTKKMLMVK